MRIIAQYIKSGYTFLLNSHCDTLNEFIQSRDSSSTDEVMFLGDVVIIAFLSPTNPKEKWAVRYYGEGS